MPIIRFVNDRNRAASQLRRIIDYAKRKGNLAEQYMAGIGINPNTAFEEMMRAKTAFHQENGKQYLHLVVSFDQALRQADTAHQIGKEIAGFYEEYQILIATHSDTENLHCHFVINSINMLTGKKLSQNRSDFWRFVEFCNEIFTKHGLPRIGSKQICELFLDDDYDFWDDDLDEFDEMIHSQLEELETRYGTCRPLFFTDEDLERADVIKSIERMEQMIGKEKQ